MPERSPGHPSHEDLLVRVARHDMEAFSRLYDVLSPLVFGLAVKVCKSRALAEEVTQEVFVQVWDQAARFDPVEGSARSWVATIAHRRSVDVVRKNQSAFERDVATPPDPPEVDVADRVVDLEEIERVRSAMEGLTDLQRQAIEMAYFGGLTYREVADQLDAPLGTIKTRMRDGLKKMRATMERQDG